MATDASILDFQLASCLVLTAPVDRPMSTASDDEDNLEIQPLTIRRVLARTPRVSLPRCSDEVFAAAVAAIPSASSTPRASPAGEPSIKSRSKKSIPATVTSAQMENVASPELTPPLTSPQRSSKSDDPQHRVPADKHKGAKAKKSTRARKATKPTITSDVSVQPTRGLG